MSTTQLTLQSALSLLHTVASFHTTHLLCPDTPRPGQPSGHDRTALDPATRVHVIPTFYTATPRRRTSPLPAELWLEIFDYATSIPGAFSSTDADSAIAFASDAHGICLRNRFGETMRTKLALSSVCRQWHHLAKPMLYRYLAVTSGAGVLRLAAHFASEDERRRLMDDAHLTMHPGQHARRLEIVLEGFHAWKERHSKALISIINHCPNLCVFSNVSCTSITTVQVLRESVLDALAQVPLKRLELKANMPLVTRLVSGCRASLAVLWLLPSESHKLSGSDDISPVHLPSLHTVITSSNATPLQHTWSMPALRSLVSSQRDLTPHLETWGHALLHLSLNLNCSLVSALRLCPNLQSLTINFDGVIMVPMAKIESHLSLRRITISDCPDFSRRLSWYNSSNSFLHDYLRKSLISLTSRDTFPALDSIRFLLPLRREPRSVQYSRDHTIPSAFNHVWETWFRLCEAQGIKVEASQGADAQTANAWQPFRPSDILTM